MRMTTQGLIYELQRMIEINIDWEYAIIHPTLYGIELVIYDYEGERVNTKRIDFIQRGI